MSEDADLHVECRRRRASCYSLRFWTTSGEELEQEELYGSQDNSRLGFHAEEIIAAQKADPQLSNREIGEFFGHGAAWVTKIVQWSTSVCPGAPDFDE